MSFKDLQEKYKAMRKKYEDANIKYLKELHQYDDLLEKDLEKFVDIDMELRKKYRIDELQKELIEVEKELIEKGKDALYKTKEFQRLPQLKQQQIRQVLEDKSLLRLCNIREKVLNILTNWKIN
jgi:phage pi2 protein 07